MVIPLFVRGLDGLRNSSEVWQQITVEHRADLNRNRKYAGTPLPEFTSEKHGVIETVDSLPRNGATLADEYGQG